MKKQSVAEQTLNKQIKSFITQADVLVDDIHQLQAKHRTTTGLIKQLEDEVTSLRDARIATSESRK